ncbi:hypothetical protein M9H77_08000 [Catharanthus roseus]|uniref:Uncharacterized protein n=1 Tax=Catharanthus roseus TaxID=4058 RepID=A0ACC0BWK5_CATRO|nr:hypothetical protein M9H77_08000 [Catharanthus roseus]
MRRREGEGRGLKQLKKSKSSNEKQPSNRRNKRATVGEDQRSNTGSKQLRKSAKKPEKLQQPQKLKQLKQNRTLLKQNRMQLNQKIGSNFDVDYHIKASGGFKVLKSSSLNKRSIFRVPRLYYIEAKALGNQEYQEYMLLKCEEKLFLFKEN